MSKISAVVSTFNEEKNIERCLKSLSFADEIIIVDNSSLDDTVGIAKRYTKKLYSQKNNPSKIDIQKNFGFEKASNEWILSVDADEEVSKQLAEEIKNIISNGEKNTNGYFIPRKNIIFGKIIEHTGWFPDPQLRLFRKGKAKYGKVHVHEQIELEGEPGYLKNYLIHHSYETVIQLVKKHVEIYAPNEAENYLNKGYKFSYFDAIRFPLSEFMGRFFVRKGYKDGIHGLMLSIFMAFYHFVIFALLWEKQNFKEYDGEEFLANAEKEFKKAGKEMVFWISKEKLEGIKNPIRKGLQKIVNEIRG